MLDYFAAKAMQGLITGAWRQENSGKKVDTAVWAEYSYIIARQMLLEREKHI